jgi:hypothetical protein
MGLIFYVFCSLWLFTFRFDHALITSVARLTIRSLLARAEFVHVKSQCFMIQPPSGCLPHVKPQG